MFKRRKREVPGLNTASTADISFMLLIFFLVVSSMDPDKGLRRTLPPIEDVEKTEVADIPQGKLLRIAISAADSVSVDGIPAGQALADSVAAFIMRAGRGHVVALSVDPGSSYDTYFGVQDALSAAYRTARSSMAVAMYGRPMAELGPEERAKVEEACPQRVAEESAIGEDGGGY